MASYGYLGTFSVTPHSRRDESYPSAKKLNSTWPRSRLKDDPDVRKSRNQNTLWGHHARKRTDLMGTRPSLVKWSSQKNHRRPSTRVSSTSGVRKTGAPRRAEAISPSTVGVAFLVFPPSTSGCLLSVTGPYFPCNSQLPLPSKKQKIYTNILPHPHLYSKPRSRRDEKEVPHVYDSIEKSTGPCISIHQPIVIRRQSRNGLHHRNR